MALGDDPILSEGGKVLSFFCSKPSKATSERELFVWGGVDTTGEEFLCEGNEGAQSFVWTD